MEAHVAFSELARNWAIVLGGFLGLCIAVWRGISLHMQANAAQHQAETAKRGHATEIFNNAVPKLKDKDEEARLGAVYTLIQLQHDYTEFRVPVFNVFCSFIRRRTAGEDKLPISVDIREVLTFIRDESHASVSGVPQVQIDLSGAEIEGVDWQNADLQGAKFSGGGLRFSNFRGARVSSSDFSECDLHMSDFRDAKLTDVSFHNSGLDNVKFQGAILTGANFAQANLKGTDFRGVDLRYVSGLKDYALKNAILNSDTKLSDQLMDTITKQMHEIAESEDDMQMKAIIAGNLYMLFRDEADL